MPELPNCCLVEGCDRPPAHRGRVFNAEGLCDAHFQRLMRLGNVQAHKPLIEKHRGCNRNSDGTQKQCMVGGCEMLATSRGYCHMHWKRVKRNGGDSFSHIPIGELVTHKAEERARKRMSKGA